MEKTIALIKPDVSRHKDIVTNILYAIEHGGEKIALRKKQIVLFSRKQAEEFYSHGRGKPWFERQVNFMCSGPSIALVLEGDGVIQKWRKMMQVIRREYSGKLEHENAVHGSDSQESFEKEYKLLFEWRPLSEWLSSEIYGLSVVDGRIVLMLDKEQWDCIVEQIKRLEENIRL